MGNQPLILFTLLEWKRLYKFIIDFQFHYMQSRLPKCSKYFLIRSWPEMFPFVLLYMKREREWKEGVISINITYSTDRYKCRTDDTPRIYLSCSHLSYTQVDRSIRHKWNTVCKAKSSKLGWDSWANLSLSVYTFAYLVLSWWIWQLEIYMRSSSLWIRLVAFQIHINPFLTNQIHTHSLKPHLFRLYIEAGIVELELVINLENVLSSIFMLLQYFVKVLSLREENFHHSHVIKSNYKMLFCPPSAWLVFPVSACVSIYTIFQIKSNCPFSISSVSWLHSIVPPTTSE
jgi:hypothetical protein